MNLRRSSSLCALAAFCTSLHALGGCASTPAVDGESPATVREANVSEAAPGTLAYDRDVWLTLIREHGKIRREMKELPDGVEAVTESDDPEIAALIRNHAFAMKARLASGRRVRQWDPVFVKLFDHRESFQLSIEATEKGVRIKETSDDPEVVRILHSHAAGVSAMVREGPAAAREETPMK